MKTAVFLTLALSLPLLAENAVMIDDFEHGINGWSGYKDAASQAPVFSLSDDALRGDNALKVKFNWQKITVPLNTMKPAGRNKRGTVFTFKPGSLYLLRLNGAVSDQPSFFLLDEIKWEIE